MDQLPRLGKRELICLLSFACNYVVFVWRGFLFLWVLGMGYVILLWHSLSLQYNYFDEDNYRDSVLYRRFYHRMCKKRKHLEPKCTKVFLMLVYDTFVNHMHVFIQLKPVIHPHQKFSKKRILSEHIKNCDLMAPATAGVSGTGSFRVKSNFKLTSYTLN